MSAVTDDMRAETLANLNAQTAKLSAETAKISLETIKLQAEIRYYPMIAMITLITGVITGIGFFVLKIIRG